MSKEAKDKFVEIVEEYFEKIEVDDDVRDYFNDLKKCHSSNRKEMTEKGASILDVLKKSHTPMTAAEIGAELLISGRSVAGSMRKLKTDGYVCAVENTSPKQYDISDKGLKFDYEPFLKNNEEE